MNVVVLTGRWTKDVDLRFSQAGKAVANCTLAVDNPFNKDDASFLRIVMFGKTAENTAQYTSKGSLVAVSGRLQSRTYERDGQKQYVTEVVADRVEFLQTKGQSEQSNGFDQNQDDDLPF